MTKAPITLQDLRRRLYVKAKAEPSWRFWGLYGHVCKRETLHAAYELAKQNEVPRVRTGSRKARALDFWALSSVGFAVGEVDGCRCGRREARSGRRCCRRSSRSFEVIGLGPSAR